MAINQHTPIRSKTSLAKELGVSRQSLYYAPKLPAKDMALKTALTRVMDKNSAYGHKRLATELGISKKRVRRVMKLFRLEVQRKRRKKPEKPEDRGIAAMNIPNRLTGKVINKPGMAWASDFTYLSFQGRFVYLATVEDIFTRQILGWTVSTRHNADLVVSALLDALGRNNKPQIFHSDQGSEYRSRLLLETLQREQILPSMSKKASPWQNGYKESFYSQFKLELGHPDSYGTMGELVEGIALQIYYYNTRRIHTALKCAPNVFAKRYEFNHLTMANQKVLIV